MSTDAHTMFGASSFCGFENPERPGWPCVMAPGWTHWDRPHVYAKGIQLHAGGRECRRTTTQERPGYSGGEDPDGNRIADWQA